MSNFCKGLYSLTDLVEGHWSALNYLLKEKTQFIANNLGTEVETSFLELIRNFKKINSFKVFFEERLTRDNSSLMADNSLAKSLLNWIPKKTMKYVCREDWIGSWSIQFDLINSIFIYIIIEPIAYFP